MPQKDKQTERERERSQPYGDAKDRPQKTRRNDRANGTCPGLLPASCSPQFLGKARIPKLVLAKIDDMQPQPMLDLEFAEVVEIRLPMPVMGKILSHTLG